MELKTKINKKLKSPIQQLSRISRENLIQSLTNSLSRPENPPRTSVEPYLYPSRFLGGRGWAGGWLARVRGRGIENHPLLFLFHSPFHPLFFPVLVVGKITNIFLPPNPAGQGYRQKHTLSGVPIFNLFTPLSRIFLAIFTWVREKV